MLVLEAEIQWLEKVKASVTSNDVSRDEWARYVYREPPSADLRKVNVEKKKRRSS